MHQEPKPRRREQKQSREVFFFPQTDINSTHHLCVVAVRVISLSNAVSDLLSLYSPRVTGLVVGFLQLWERSVHAPDCSSAEAHIVMQSMQLLPHLLFHSHFWRINHLSQDICFWFGLVNASCLRLKNIPFWTSRLLWKCNGLQITSYPI